jgi:hypothetical protein
MRDDALPYLHMQTAWPVRYVSAICSSSNERRRGCGCPQALKANGGMRREVASRINSNRAIAGIRRTRKS